MSKVCKFYAQGNCSYGSSCRFYHSDTKNRSNYQYGNEYQPRHKYENEAHRDTYRNYEDYNQNEQHNYYQHGSKSNNYYSTKDYNSRNNNGQNYDYKYEKSYNSHKNYNNKNSYRPQQERNVENYYKEYNNDENANNDFNKRSYKYKNKLENQYRNDNNVEYTKNNKAQLNLNRNKNYEETMNNKQHEQNIVRQNGKYENEMNALKSQIKGLVNSTVWPLTCFHPVGHKYPIQPVGILNLPDVSFEELRCDYYLSKNISADPGLIHKKLIENLLSKTQLQKEQILSLTENVKSDMIATFDKCQLSKSEPTFQNTIHMDQNTYWNMSINQKTIPESAIKAQLDSFSFVIDKKEPETDDKSSSLKIFMQTDVYGTTDCEEFAQENFTNFIPILPPPKRYCV